MSTSHAVARQDVGEHSFVTLIKRTPIGRGEPHLVQASEVDTIEKLLQISQRIFDTDILPRIFTENNCPIPHMCWADTLRGTGRYGQRFYLETYDQQYTKGTDRSGMLQNHSQSNGGPPPPEIRLVILVEYPIGLFSTHPLPDDLIVESISPDMRFEVLANNIQSFLTREFSPNGNFFIDFEDAERQILNPGSTVAECGLSAGSLVHCRLKTLDFNDLFHLK